MSLIISIWNMFVHMAPWLLLGFFIAGFMSLIPQRMIHRHLGGEGLVSILKSCAFGIPMPLCSCSVVPAGIGLYKKGASRSSAVAFLVSTPQTGVDSIVLSAAALGMPFAFIKVFGALLLGVMAGLFSGNTKANSSVEESKKKTKSIGTHFKDMLYFSWVDLPRPLAFPLMLGIIVSGVISFYVEPGLMGSHLGSGWLAMVLTLVFSVPLYICATASIPLAMLLVEQGMGSGSALVLLMAGPATNAATMWVIAKNLGKRAFAAYLGSIVFGSLLIGYFAGHYLNIESSGFVHQHDLDSPSILFHLCGVILLGLFLPAIFDRFKSFKKYFGTSQAKTLSENQTRYVVSGMTCEGCVNKAKGILREAKITVAEMDLKNTVLEGQGSDDQKKIESLFSQTGFSFKKES